MAKIVIKSFVEFGLYDCKVGDVLELKAFNTTVKVVKAPACDSCFLDDSARDMPKEEREKYWKYCGVSGCAHKLNSFSFVKVDGDGRDEGKGGD